MVEASKASFQAQQSKKAVAKEASAGSDKSEITFEQFQNLDLRVGEIVSAERVKKRAYMLEVDNCLGLALTCVLAQFHIRGDAPSAIVMCAYVGGTKGEQLGRVPPRIIP